MANYTELVEVLRECSKLGTRYGMAVIYMEKAADAIENISKAYQMMAEAYEAEVTKPRWIPVKERLPEKDGSYLVRFGNGLITTDTFMTFEDGHTKWYDGGYDIGGITHWMPLPSTEGLNEI